MIRTYYSVAYSFWSKWYWTAAFQWRLKFSSSFTLEPLNDPSTLLSFTANTMYSFGDDVYLSLSLSEILQFTILTFAGKTLLFCICLKKEILGQLTNLTLVDDFWGDKTINTVFLRSSCYLFHSPPPFVCCVLAARVKVERPLWVSVRGQLAFCTTTTTTLWVPAKCPYSLCRVCPTTFRVNISGRVGRSRRKDWFWRNQRQRKELSQHKFSIEMQEKVVKRSHLPPA